MFNKNRSHWRVVLAVGVCAALLVLPVAAFGQDALSNPSASQYVPQSQVQGTNTNGTAAKNTSAPTATATNGASGTLPFTGMDLAVVAGVAVTMVVAGLALRRLSAPRRI